MSFIYFIQAQGDGPIKIGTTAFNPLRRMVKIQSDCPWPVKLLGAIRGTLSQEKEIHALLSPWRTQGEWFLPHSIVLAAVREALRVGEPISQPSRRPKYSHPICKYRSENDLTLNDVAGRVNLTRASLSRIESGRSKPSWHLACRLSKATGIHVKEIRPDIHDLVFGEVLQ